MPTFADLRMHSIALSLLAAIVGIAFGALSWQALLDDMGAPVGIKRGAQIFLVGALGKYLPGSLWAYVLQIELGRKAGLERARVFAATVFSIAVMVVAALLAGLFAIPALVGRNDLLSWLPWLYILLPCGLFLLAPPVLTRIAQLGFRVLRRPDPGHPIGLRAVFSSISFALGSYVAFGAHLWLLLEKSSKDDFGISLLALTIGTMGIAMLSGLVFFLLPSGIGARELVMIVALGPLVGVGAATAYAAVSRFIFTVADLLTAGLAAGLAVVSRRRRRQYQEKARLHG